MSAILTLSKRNMKIFLRDRATVFFSFLSALMVVMLYFLFIADIYTDGMDILAEEIGTTSLPKDARNFIVYSQMMAGILVLCSMSLATGAFSTIAKDFEDRRVDCLLLTPIKTHELILSYYVTGLVASFVVNAFTWLVSFTVIGMATGYWLSSGAFAMVLAGLLTASLISASIMLLLTSAVKSSTAIGVINGIMGTFIGFLCGIYMPYSSLGEGTKAVGSVLPFTHLTIWLKRIMLGDAFSQTGIVGIFEDVLYSDFFSADGVGFLSFDVPLPTMVIFSGTLALACLTVSWVLLRKRMKGNYL